MIDTDRLVQIAAALKDLDQSRESLLAELRRVAGGSNGAAPIAGPRRGRPPGSKNKTKAATPPAGGKQRKGLTTDVLGVLADGGAHTAGDIVAKLKLPATKSKISSVSTTLVRLAKERRVKKDKVRGYRAA